MQVFRYIAHILTNYLPMLDQIDQKILRLLQMNAALTNAELAERINTSVSQAGRRKHRLDKEGYIIASRAQLNPERLGLNIEAFIEVALSWHNTDTSHSFHELLNDQEEVIGVWTLTGQADYLVHVFCADLKQLNNLVHEVLLRHSAVSKVESKIVMSQIKTHQGLPIPSRY